MTALLFGPLPWLLALLTAAWVWRRRLGAARSLILAVVALAVWVLTSPACANLLTRWAEGGLIPLPPAGPLEEADAIVVLAAGHDPTAPEYGAAVPGDLTARRLAYAAALHRRTGFPVAVSGGPARGVVLADTMAAALSSLAVPVRWRERASRTTWENAQLTAALLQREGVRRVLLVSTAAHLPRAAWAFRAAGFEIVPAGTDFAARPDLSDPGLYLPQWDEGAQTGLALHELLGFAWYRLVYGGAREPSVNDP